MKCEPCTYLQESEEDSLPISSSDIRQLSLLSGSHMPAKSSGNGQQTDGFPICGCGKEMSDCLTHPSTPEAWIASMQDSLVKILALQESRQELLKEPGRGFTEKSCVLLGLLDRDTSSWKMWPLLPQRVLNKLSKTWPKWGMTLDGVVFAHPMSERRITGIGGGVWPTPRANSTMAATITQESSWDSKRFPNLETVVGRMMWPTPTAHNAKEGAYPAEYTRKTPSLASKVGGKLNPEWIEWLMGFPIGYTDSKDWEMVKSHSKQQSRGNSSEDNK